MLRAAYLLSHPIQYQSPLLRRLALEPELDLTVLYTSDFSLRSYHDKGFGVSVAWDIPLLDGYRYEFLPRLLDANSITFLRPLNYGLYQRLRRGKFDVLWIHGYATLNSLMAMLAAKALGIPVLLRTDSTLIDHPRSRATLFAKDLFFRMLHPLVFGVLSVGRHNTEYWRHHMGEAVHIFPMPYAVDNAFFAEQADQAAASRESLRVTLELEANRQVILFASKLLPRKRCIDLVEAYLQYTKGMPEEKRPYLLIIGDGEERSRVEARIAQSSAKGIRMLGFRNQTELPRFYDLCDVFVLPSIHEPWGLVVNEVMNAGRAVIVTDQVGCQPDLVQDGDTGCVYPAKDVPALSSALARVLQNPEACRNMGQRGRAHIQQYSFEADVRGLMEAFRAASAWKTNPHSSRTAVHE
ncbi:MAG TPA: glycosyltransferase family 4 protein [Acidobacteriaceae bacterium]|jgi:glycosyltransferase involved in cell wall biosynthesis|nr:glycosyltransferase family 4 protein [Acidobacteriaceae bacterium]